MFVIRPVHAHQLSGPAQLEDKRLDGPAGIQEEPGGVGARSKVGGGQVTHLMGGGEKVLPVITGGVESPGQQVRDQLFRVFPGFLGQRRHDGIVKPQLVVFDVVPVHFDGGFPVLGFHLEGLGLQRADLPVPDPFPHHGKIQEEVVIHNPGGGRHRHGRLFIPGLGVLEGGVEHRGKAGVQSR